MADVVVKTESLVSVADAIRAKNGTTDTLNFPVGFADAINALPQPLPTPYQYTTILEKVFMNSKFDYKNPPDMVIDAPNVERIVDLCGGSQGTINKLKIMTSNEPTKEIILEEAFADRCQITQSAIHNGTLSHATFKILDLTDFHRVISNGKDMFKDSSYVREILGELDFSNWLNFSGWEVFPFGLREVRIKPYSIKCDGFKVGIGRDATPETVASVVNAFSDESAGNGKACYLKNDFQRLMTQAQKDELARKKWTVLQ